MEEYTHVRVVGSANIPEKFWKYIFYTEEEYQCLSDVIDPDPGFIRKMNDKDRILCTQTLDGIA